MLSRGCGTLFLWAAQSPDHSPQGLTPLSGATWWGECGGTDVRAVGLTKTWLSLQQKNHADSLGLEWA